MGDGKVHKYMECSGKGICDRSTSECECFEGYDGKGCQRTTCPNDCSGHGTCEFIDELTFGSTPGEYDAAKPANFSMGLSTDAMTFASIGEVWDSYKSMACVCDPGYIDVDCSRRMCPKGNDIFDTRLDTADDMRYQVQNISLFAAGPFGNGTNAAYTEFANQTFALKFVSTLNESYTTIPIIIGNTLFISDDDQTAAFAKTIKAALEGLPNGVIDTVGVSVAFAYDLCARLLAHRWSSTSRSPSPATSCPGRRTCSSRWSTSASPAAPQRSRASTSSPSRANPKAPTLQCSTTAKSPRWSARTTTTTSVGAVASATTTVESASASRATPGWPAAPRLPWCKAQSQTTVVELESGTWTSASGTSHVCHARPLGL